MGKTVRRLTIVGVILVAAGSYMAFFGYQTFMLLETQYLAWKHPVVRKIPAPLPQRDISSLPGTKLSFLGYEFEIPWDDIDGSKTKQVNNMVSIFFRSGNAMVISRVPPKDFVRSVMSEGNLDEATFRSIYGDEAVRSDYQLKQVIFQSTPASVELLGPKEVIAAKAMMLVTKASVVPAKDSEIYFVQSADFNGFQLGNPARRPTTIALELYRDDGELELVLMQKKQGPPASISQPEVNRIIQSVRKVDSSQGK